MDKTPEITEHNRNELYQEYWSTLEDYYRHVIRKQDELVLKRIQKIPDNWNDFNSIDDTIKITDSQKKRLSDIKKAKSWELNFESLYVYFLINIEHILLDMVSYRNIDDDDLSEMEDSINTIMLKIGSNITNFKHLMLSLAKRSVSDFFYLMNAWIKFYKFDSPSFDGQLDAFCRDVLNHIKLYRAHRIIIKRNIEMKNEIDGLFSRSSNVVGWRIDEFAVKDFIEKNRDNPLYTAEELLKRIQSCYKMSRVMIFDFDFLTYYYNKYDGKEYRFKFILESLGAKLKEKKITPEMFNGMEEIFRKFMAIKQDLKSRGIPRAGFEDYSFSDLIEFTFKCSKILEFRYLRKQKHEKLAELRNMYINKVEKDMEYINGLTKKSAENK